MDNFFFLTFYLFIMHGMYACGDPSTTAVSWKSEETVLASTVGSGDRTQVITLGISLTMSLVLRK